ncbi:ABC transporter substrate-binding protein [Kribbella sp. NPDC050820]|uniref:ABC transporter substrate-binding protein n=1 Tax=Kribbella sp. NPDC050820 TaxID=3155408 RepID=UPI0033F063DB
MRTRSWTGAGCIAVATSVLALAGCAGAEGSDQADGDCSNFKVAVADDDVRRAALYAIEHDKIDVAKFPGLKLSYLTFPALIQATGTDQFDVIESSLVGVPQARSKGVDLKIVALSSGRTADENTPGASGVYVRDGSDIRTPEDLAGKTIGVTSFGSSSTMVTRILLRDGHKLNSALQGGDLKWVEMDPAQLTAALERGQIDAVSDFSFTAYKLGHDSQFRRIMTSDPAWRKLTGHNPVFASYQALATQTERNQTCYKQFQELLAASVAYARDHIDELANAISAKTRLPAEYITFQWSGAYDYIGGLDPEWLESAQVMWDKAAAGGDIPKALQIQDEIIK